MSNDVSLQLTCEWWQSAEARWKEALRSWLDPMTKQRLDRINQELKPIIAAINRPRYGRGGWRGYV